MESAIRGDFLILRISTLVSEPFDPEPAIEVGARLVNAHFTAPEALGRTLQLLGTGLVRPAGISSEDLKLLDRVVQLLGRLSTGYSEALRERTFEEQEVIKQAMWLATDVAQRRLQDSESRFLAVFDSAPIGLAIGDFEHLQSGEEAAGELWLTVQAELAKPADWAPEGHVVAWGSSGSPRRADGDRSVCRGRPTGRASTSCSAPAASTDHRKPARHRRALPPRTAAEPVARPHRQRPRLAPARRRLLEGPRS